MNNNYAQDFIENLGNSIDRVIDNKLIVSFAKKKPKYNEMDENKPNFYDWYSYKIKAKLDESLTIESYIDTNIINYNVNDLDMTTVSSDSIIQGVMFNGDRALISIAPESISQALQIPLKEVYALSYMKIEVLDTNETKYYWIEDFMNNGDKTNSVSLICFQDYWMTFYKDLILNQSGNIKINRKLEDRGTLNTDNSISMNYNLDSPVNNIDSQYGNLTTNIVKSTGWEVAGDGFLPNGTINIPNNKVYRYPHTKDANGDIAPVQELVEGISLYNEAGELTTNAATQEFKIDGRWGMPNVPPFAPVVATAKRSDTGPVKQSIVYGPKVLKFDAPVEPQTYNYYYTKQLDGDIAQPDGDAYGIVASPIPLKLTTEIINRIGNVSNRNNLSQTNSNKNVNDRVGEEWRWVVQYTDVEGSEYVSKSPNTVVLATLEVEIYRPKMSRGKVFLVDWNTWNPVDRKFDVQYRTGGECIQQSAFNTFFYRAWASFVPVRYGNLGYYESQLYISFNGDVSVQQANNKSIAIQNLGIYIQSLFVSVQATNILPKLLQSTFITDSTLDTGISIRSEYPISEWNKHKTLPATPKRSIGQLEYNDLFKPLSNDFKDVMYEKDSIYDFKREKKIYTSSVMKTTIEYLGTSKQVFNEFGGTGAMYLAQNIYPTYCEDRVYTTNEHTFNTLNNTKGYLSKSYNNALPSVMGTYQKFMETAGASYSTQMLTATTNVDYQKRKETLSNQHNESKYINSMVQGVIGIGTSAGTGATAGAVAAGSKTGNPAGAIAGAIAGGVKGTSSLIGQGILGQQGLEMSRLANEQTTFNAKQAVNQLASQQIDLMNSPDQLNQGGSDVNSIIEQKGELKALYEKFSTEGEDNLIKEITFQVQTQAPNIPKLKEIAMFYNKYGYIYNTNQEDFQLLHEISRQRFNFFQFDQVSHTINTNLPKAALNYFDSVFNSGVRMWNVYDTNINDYSKENWELSFLSADVVLIINPVPTVQSTIDSIAVQLETETDPTERIKLASSLFTGINSLNYYLITIKEKVNDTGHWVVSLVALEGFRFQDGTTTLDSKPINTVLPVVPIEMERSVLDSLIQELVVVSPTDYRKQLEVLNKVFTGIVDANYPNEFTYQYDIPSSTIWLTAKYGYEFVGNVNYVTSDFYQSIAVTSIYPYPKSNVNYWAEQINKGFMSQDTLNNIIPKNFVGLTLADMSNLVTTGVEISTGVWKLVITANVGYLFNGQFPFLEQFGV